MDDGVAKPEKIMLKNVKLRKGHLRKDFFQILNFLLTWDSWDLADVCFARNMTLLIITIQTGFLIYYVIMLFTFVINRQQNNSPFLATK